jgi:hypothetical protein
MSAALFQSLLITLLGMSLVFGAILLLWGVMALLTWLLAEQTPELSIVDTERVHRARAAAAAVTVALAEQAQSRIAQFPMPHTALVSAWQLGMRTRQMTQKGSLKR